MKYKIYGKYNGRKWELIDSASTKQECYYMLNEYRIAYGRGWEFKTNIKED